MIANTMGTIPVCQAFQTGLFTVTPTTTIEEVALLFAEKKINAAPVVDAVGKCVGIITSYDLVRYEAHRKQVEGQCYHGIAFELRRGDHSLGLIGQPFDEVAFHMTDDFETVDRFESLEQAARRMCRKRRHHLITIDEYGRPTAILSSLDILGRVLEIPVSAASE